MELRSRFTPTKSIRILGLDKRDVKRLAWCAAASGISKLLWIDGYLVCVEVYDKAFEYEVERRFFPISQVCYASFPNYTELYDVGKGMQLPIVDVSDMAIYGSILKVIRSHEEKSLKK